MGIFGFKFSMNVLMTCPTTSASPASGGRRLRRRGGEAEIGTVVAFVSGLSHMNDPWGDLVGWFRDVSVTRTKYDLIVRATSGPAADGVIWIKGAGPGPVTTDRRWRPDMTDAILAINAGSSSLKFALYDAESLAALCRGGVLGARRFSPARDLRPPGAHRRPADGLRPCRRRRLAPRRAPARAGLAVRAAGHRVVHGGRDFSAPVRIDDAVLARLDRLVPLARATSPSPSRAPGGGGGLAGPQIACFDTAFHRSQPRLAQLFPIRGRSRTKASCATASTACPTSTSPRSCRRRGPRAEGRVIVAHLGHGASLCALRNRRSIASTMGLTALDGLMMGTRSGSVDPGSCST